MYSSSGYSNSGYSEYSGDRKSPGMVSLFEILFSEASNTYLEGQEIKGEVSILGGGGDTGVWQRGEMGEGYGGRG